MDEAPPQPTNTWKCINKDGKSFYMFVEILQKYKGNPPMSIEFASFALYLPSYSCGCEP